jgi:hypothetical protein
MPFDVMLKANRSPAIASTTSLEAQTLLLNNKKPPQPQEVPEATQQAMQEQGMSMGGNFSPGEPIQPYQPVGTAPIITPYQVGQNIYAVPRGITGVSFDSLKGITSKWDVARLCIEVRQDELRALDWEIVVEDGVDADMYEAELKAARKFFEHPAPGDDFDDLQMRASDDWLRYDALAIARRRLRNGQLGALEAIDGTSIAPLIDGRGAMPIGDAPAYVQWSWGLPWVWLSERDIIYKPHHPRTETRYGLPPAEWVLLTGNTDVRLQWYFLTYFTEGEVPEAFVNAPPDVQDPKQVKALQDAYSAVMSGANAAHHKVKWIPPGSNVHLVNKGNFDVGFAGFLLAKGCAAYKVQPAEIGFTEKVNKSSGDTQADVTYRRSIKPSVQYFQSIWNKILREDLNMPYARFKYLNVEEEEDQLKLANTRAVYIQNAVLSPDEVRAELGYDVDPDAPVGRAFAMRTGVIFVDAASQEAARKQGSLAQQYGLELGEEPDDDTDMMNPRQTIVAPVIKPVPPKPAETPSGTPATTTSTAADESQTSKAVEAELRKWRQVAVKRAKDGKLQKVFESSVIDPLLHKAVSAQLAKAQTADEVRAVFGPLIGGDAPPGNFTRRATNIRRGRGRLVARDEAKLKKLTDELKHEITILLQQQGPKIAKHVASRMSSEEFQYEVHIVAENEAAGELAATMDEGQIDEILGTYGWQGWDKQLKSAVSDSTKQMFLQAAEEGTKALGSQLSWDIINPKAVEYAENRGAELVGRKLIDGDWVDNPNAEFSIPDATRQMVKDYVVSAMKQGSSVNDIEKGIQEHYAFSDRRAETIARTETGFAYNAGANTGFRQAKVQHVEVFDGDDDPDCAAADGSTWTIEEAEANPLGHPNCVRAFGPIPPDEDPDYIPDADVEDESS